MKNRFMIRNKIVAILFVTTIFVFSGFKKKSSIVTAEDKWSGTVTFYEKRMGPKIIRSEWWMIGKITKNVGNGLDSSICENTDGEKARCATNEKTELELGIDEQKKEYGITIRIPGCYGTMTDRNGKAESYGLTDETAIVIERQKLGSNPNLLEGRTRTVDGPDANGSESITIYEWNLKKVN